MPGVQSEAGASTPMERGSLAGGPLAAGKRLFNRAAGGPQRWVPMREYAGHF
jgi:hypothetical protein